jgi:hypothetical protein
MSSTLEAPVNRAPWYEKYKVDVPEGASGEWRVERFVVGDEDARWSALRAAVTGRGREVYPGTYTRLMRGSVLVMSDTPAEVSDHREAIRRAHGRVLIHGLGLGMVLKAMLAREQVERVDVVEVSEDVIRLVAPTYTADPRVHIHHGDAITFRFPAGQAFDVVWHDIWDYICADNLPEMRRAAPQARSACRLAGIVGSSPVRTVNVMIC